MQAETSYHSQLPLERLYAGLTSATKGTDASAELLGKMQQAVQAESGRLRKLRAEEASMEARRASAEHGADAAAVLSGIHALLQAKLRLMRGDAAAFGGGERPLVLQQFETGAGNVLSLA